MASKFNEAKIMSRPEGAVRFSRVLRLPSLIMLGASISVGLGVFTLLGQFLRLSPSEVASTYFLMALFTIPLILTYAERAAVIPGGGGTFNLARNSNLEWLAYASGWLLLGGHAALIALLGWGGSLHLNIIFSQIFDRSLALPILAAVIIGLVTLNNLLGTGGSWRTRNLIISASLLLLLFVILRNLFVIPPDRETTVLVLGSPRNIMRLVTLMASGLWGLNLILSVRDEIHRPSHTILPSLFITVALTAGLGLLAALGALGYPVIIRTSLTPLPEIIANYGTITPELVIILYALFGLLVVLVALNQAIASSLRMIGAMAQDGYFPGELQSVSGLYRVQVIPLVSLALFSIVLVVFVPIMTLVGLAAMTFLFATAIVHIPDLFRKRPNLPEKRSPKLPFHPLLPGLTVAIGLLLPVNLDRNVWEMGIAWLILGSLYYVLYARRRSLTVRRQATVLGETGLTPSSGDSNYKVMVGIAQPKTASFLIEAGAKLAQARGGQLLALHIIVLPEQIPGHLKRIMAQEEWERLRQVIEAAAIDGVEVKPLVRLAPNPAAGILETVREEGVDLLLLGWRQGRPKDDIHLDPVLDPIISSAPCDVAILRGRLPQVVKRVLVPTAGGPYTSQAIALGQDLAEPNEGQILLVNLVEDHLTAEREAEATAILAKAVASLDDQRAIEQSIREANAIKEGILTATESSDLLVMGASREGFLGASTLDGLPSEVIYASTKPTILVRRREGLRHVWLSRAWEVATTALPTLTPARRDEVTLQMRQAAQPTVDFFVLILLSAMIATIGLLQNSGAVIIGAMLVAPLMSPILTMGISLIQGNLTLLRIAGESTVKGIFLAILVGVVITLISPINDPTAEITARTSPNILDLMIAIAAGTAAAYAVSRKKVAAALPGVAIAVALVPPLGVVGYGLGTSQLFIAAGALLLFLTNLTAIIFASALTFLGLGFYPKLDQKEEKTVRLRGLQITVASLIIVATILGMATVATVQQSERVRGVENILRELVGDQAEVLDVRVERGLRSFNISTTLIVFDLEDLTPEELDELEIQLTEATGGPVTLDATILVGSRTRLYE